jgi:hypothetical protein
VTTCALCRSPADMYRSQMFWSLVLPVPVLLRIHSPIHVHDQRLRSPTAPLPCEKTLSGTDALFSPMPSWCSEALTNEDGQRFQSPSDPQLLQHSFALRRFPSSGASTGHLDIQREPRDEHPRRSEACKAHALEAGGRPFGRVRHVHGDVPAFALLRGTTGRRTGRCGPCDAVPVLTHSNCTGASIGAAGR